ncbi:unnamed protein product [Medioppia subpectinata]|uniref:Uncharacterized protein n=1 Tax=Medioppia subpectinata TaxID=1979941 RepID=A0A7R9KHL9_9ACAR|nr:unnamed protein product [Medioppia subpectinata]CAG2103576.1 unnamed protein product [Medioppia subpectinata]
MTILYYKCQYPDNYRVLVNCSQYTVLSTPSSTTTAFPSTYSSPSPSPTPSTTFFPFSQSGDQKSDTMNTILRIIIFLLLLVLILEVVVFGAFSLRDFTVRPNPQSVPNPRRRSDSSVDRGLTNRSDEMAERQTSSPDVETPSVETQPASTDVIERQITPRLLARLGSTGQLTSVRITAQTASVVSDSFPHEKYSMAFVTPYGTGRQEWITGFIYHKSSIDWMAMNLKGYELEKKSSGDQWKNGSIDFGQDFNPSLAFYASIVGHNGYELEKKSSGDQWKNGSIDFGQDFNPSLAFYASIVGHNVSDVCFAAQTSVSKGSYRREYRCYEFDDQLKPTISTDRVIKGIQSKMTADNDPKATQPLTSLTSPETNRPLIAVFVFNLFDTNETLITHYLFLYNEDKVVSYCHSSNSLFHSECQHPDNYTVYANCSQFKAKPTTSHSSAANQKVKSERNTNNTAKKYYLSFTESKEIHPKKKNNRIGYMLLDMKLKLQIHYSTSLGVLIQMKPFELKDWFDGRLTCHKYWYCYNSGYYLKIAYNTDIEAENNNEFGNNQHFIFP